MKKRFLLPTTLFIVALLLLFFSACDNSKDNSDSDSKTPVAGTAPALADITITATGSYSITIAQPLFSTAGDPAPVVSAYIGRNDTINLNDTEVTGEIQGPIDVSSEGCTFTGLQTGTLYRIIVTARNNSGFSSASIMQSTGPIAPGLKDLVVSDTGTDFITLSRPAFEVVGNPLPSVNAYIGLAGDISVSGTTIINSLQGPVDVSSGGYTFNGLDIETSYSIIVIAENSEDSSVKEITASTEEPVLSLFCNYESKYIHQGATVTFSTDLTEGVIVISLGTSSDPDAEGPDSDIWYDQTTWTFSATGTVKLFGRLMKDGVQYGPLYSFVYEVAEDYPWYDEEGLPKDDTSLVAWADGYSEFERGYDRTSIYENPDVYGDLDYPERAYGPATGDNFDVVVLGNHGYITLTFSSGISNGDGFDLVVFENGFGTEATDCFFAELGYVEVSSDGTNFVRFDSVSRTAAQPGGYGNVYVHNIYGLCGMHPNAYGTSLGTPFDLDWLKNKKSVVEGLVDLNNITHVKIIDIPGNGEEADADGDLISDADYAAPSVYFPCYDSFDNVIYDAFRTWGTGGVDLEAIGVIHTAE